MHITLRQLALMEAISGSDCLEASHVSSVLSSSFQLGTAVTTAEAPLSDYPNWGNCFLFILNICWRELSGTFPVIGMWGLTGSVNDCRFVFWWVDRYRAD